MEALTRWLSDLGLERYATAFRASDIDFDILPELTEADLEKLGVSLGHRKKLLRAIAALPAPAGRREAAVAGAYAAPGTPPTSASEGERRQVTVMFADLTGSTELARSLDAEEMHRLLNRFFERTSAIIEAYKGTVDKYIGDSVMAVFGAPVAHDNDPERAVRAAREICAEMPQLSLELGHRLSVHVGIASGEVVFAAPGRREYTVTGESVNLASRLQDLAEPGEVLVSEAVQREIARKFGCEAAGSLEIAGFDHPVRVWRVVAAEPLGRGYERPFVGRHAELNHFSQILRLCGESRIGQAVYVRGEAGIGKSRLVYEFQRLARREGFRCYTGLVLDFGVGRGQDAVRAIVRAMLDVPEGAPDAARREAVRQALASGAIGGEHAIFLNDLLDVPQELEEKALYDAMDDERRNEGKRETLLALLGRMASQHPALVVVEDIHWADQILLAYLAAMAELAGDHPIILLMTSRSEGDPIDRAWHARAQRVSVLTIDLAPLRAADAIELAGSYIDATSDYVQRCVERAEGNPLFLDQLLRNAEMAGAETIPASLQSLVQARLDQLNPADKEAIQAASVVGQRFSLSVLRHLLGSDGYDCAALIERYLVRPEGEGYLFAHALIREAVYLSMLKSVRRKLHLAAAQWYATRDPVVRAEHLERAEDAQVPAAYLEAAEGLMGKYKAARALPLVERGLALLTDRNEEARSALQRLRGRLLHDLGRVPESIEAYQHAIAAAASPRDACQGWIGVAAGKRILDDYDGALDALARAEELAGQGGWDLELSRIHYYRGNIYFPLGNIEGCLAEQEQALSFARKVGDPEAEARALSGSGDAFYSKGRMKTALTYFRTCVELCRHHGFGRIEVGNRYMVAWTEVYQNRLAAALTEAEAACAAAEQVGHRRAEIVARLTAGRILYETGRYDEAETQLETGYARVREMGTLRFEPFYMIYLARIMHRDPARRDGAEQAAMQAFETAQETGITFVGPWVLGTLALVTGSDATREQALLRGEELLRKGCVGHNHIDFYRDAMEISLRRRAWDEVEAYAAKLEAFTESEPLPWSEFFIRRARTLSALGRGVQSVDVRDQAVALKQSAEASGLIPATRLLSVALGQA